MKRKFSRCFLRDLRETVTARGPWEPSQLLLSSQMEKPRPSKDEDEQLGGTAAWTRPLALPSLQLCSASQAVVEFPVLCCLAVHISADFALVLILM